MLIACLDLEGVLLPEIWINVADVTNIQELRLTTRDISDYDKLMTYRLKILKEKNIKIYDIEKIICDIHPLNGALAFLQKLRQKFQVVILSDTFYQFAMPLMKKINYPLLFCHNLVVDNAGYITDYKLRLKDSKKRSVVKLKELNFKIIACGDSYNDISMLKTADRGIFFSPPKNVTDEYPKYPVARDYAVLWKEFLTAERELNSIS